MGKIQTGFGGEVWTDGRKKGRGVLLAEGGWDIVGIGAMRGDCVDIGTDGVLGFFYAGDEG